jgi:hypothetical protein
MKYHLPLPVHYAKDLALTLLNQGDAQAFTQWLLAYWHLMPPAGRQEMATAIQKRATTDSPAAKPYLEHRYGTWMPLLERHQKPTYLDKALWDESTLSDLVALARRMAVFAHDGAGQLYAGRPYSVHLLDVATLAEQYQHLLFEPLRAVAVAASWLHDAIEDGFFTFNDLVKVFGQDIAQTAQLCVSSTGATRTERHDAAYHQRVASTLLSTYVKVVDRLANVQKGGSMAEKYKKEQAHFEAGLNIHDRYPQLLPLLMDLRIALGLRTPITEAA